MGFRQFLSLVVLVTTQSYSTAIECKEGYVRDEANDGTECFKVFNGAGANFADAQAACVADGAVLTRVINLPEQDFLRSHIQGQFMAYIGAFTERTDDLKWVDTERATSFSKRPNTLTNNEAYLLHAQRARWIAAKKDELHPYICRATTGPSACDPGWTKYEGKCYRHFADPALHPPLSQADAEKACNEEGGHLVSIHSAAENNFLKSFIGTAKAYTGGLMLSTSPEVASFNWTDGSPMDYMKLPNRYEGGMAIELDGDKAKWQLFNPRQLKQYICKRDIGPVITTTLAPTPPPECPADWSAESSLGFCYRLFAGPLHINDATAACRALGAELVSIHSDEEDAFVKGLLPNIGDIGLTGGASVASGIHVWNDESPFDYFDRVPDNPTPFVPFVVVKAADITNRWQTIDSSATTPYICKQPGAAGGGGGGVICEDGATNCEQLKVNCLFSKYYDTMKSACNKTCDFCNCEDTNPEECAKLESRCHATPAMITKMADLCPLTCKLCGCKDRKTGCVKPDSCSESDAKVNCAKTCGLC